MPAPAIPCAWASHWSPSASAAPWFALTVTDPATSSSPSCPHRCHHIILVLHPICIDIRHKFPHVQVTHIFKLFAMIHGPPAFVPPPPFSSFFPSVTSLHSHSHFPASTPKLLPSTSQSPQRTFMSPCHFYPVSGPFLVPQKPKRNLEKNHQKRHSPHNPRIGVAPSSLARSTTTRASNPKGRKEGSRQGRRRWYLHSQSSHHLEPSSISTYFYLLSGPQNRVPERAVGNGKTKLPLGPLFPTAALFPKMGERIEYV